DQQLKSGNRIAFLVVQDPQGRIVAKGKKLWHDPLAGDKPSLRKIVLPDGQQLKHRLGTVLAGTVVSITIGEKTRKRKPIYLQEVGVTVKDVRVEKSAATTYAYYLFGDGVIEIQEVFVGNVRLGRLCWSLRPGKASRGIPLHSLPSMPKAEYDDRGRKVDWKRRRRNIDDATAARIQAYLASRDTMTQASA
ncbi:MAG: hypothetical protein HGA31_06900, partial [Candidatus Moranbacteria bacterium]|nr:hypothetical protein [Candidatus Moranbacteria bacterium]